jgi:hypothetical protein
MELIITNARTLDCSEAFPPTALSVRMRIFEIVPPDSAVLIYTRKTGDTPVRFIGPETTADVPVEGHEMFAQSIQGNKDYRVQILGYRDD